MAYTAASAWRLARAHGVRPLPCCLANLTPFGGEAVMRCAPGRREGGCQAAIAHTCSTTN